MKDYEVLSARWEQIFTTTCYKFPMSKSGSVKYRLTLLTAPIRGQEISLLETLNENLSMNETVQRVD